MKARVYVCFVSGIIYEKGSEGQEKKGKGTKSLRQH